MPSRKNKTYSQAVLSIYDFDRLGDVLPMHRHLENPEENHISIVARGSFICRGSGWQKTIKAGDVLYFEPDQWHEFEAIEEHSRIVNILHPTAKLMD